MTEGGVGASYAGPSQFPHFSFQVWISFAQFEASTGTDESMEQARFVDEKNCNSSWLVHRRYTVVWSCLSDNTVNLIACRESVPGIKRWPIKLFRRPCGRAEQGFLKSSAWFSYNRPWPGLLARNMITLSPGLVTMTTQIRLLVNPRLEVAELQTTRP